METGAPGANPPFPVPDKTCKIAAVVSVQLVRITVAAGFKDGDIGYPIAIEICDGDLTPRQSSLKWNLGLGTILPTLCP